MSGPWVRLDFNTPEGLAEIERMIEANVQAARDWVAATLGAEDGITPAHIAHAQEIMAAKVREVSRAELALARKSEIH